jgi:histidyl-tRNA synthetase
MITIGERELAEQSANIKNMSTGKEITVKLVELYTNLPDYVTDAEENEEQ